MHEYSITSSIIEILDRLVGEKKLDRVKQVDFEINEFAAIEPDSIRFYYEFLTGDNPVLRYAKLHFLKVNPEMTCNNCGISFKVESFLVKCPDCNSKSIRFKKTDDIRITAIHTEDPDL